MQIREAHEEVKKMAGDRYCVTHFEMDSHNGKDRIECLCYIEGLKHGRAADFKTALMMLRAQTETGKPEEEQTMDA